MARRPHVHRRRIESPDEAHTRINRDPRSPFGLLGTCASRNCAERVKVYPFDASAQDATARRDFRVVPARA